MLGPSGYGFLHPGMIAHDDPLLRDFINRTGGAAELLATSAYVHWDQYDNGCVVNATDTGETLAAPGCSDELRMEEYLRRLEGSSIKSVFSPVTPFVPRHVGKLAVLQEVYRWFKEESNGSVAERLGHFRKGTIGYVYMIPGVSMDSLEDLGQNVPDHVQLVGYRELADISMSRAAGLAGGPAGMS